MNNTLKDHLHRLVQFLLVTCLVVGLTPPLTVKADAPVEYPIQIGNFSGRICPSDQRPISNLVYLDGKMYFVASQNDIVSLWKSDGTPEGTQSLFDFPNRMCTRSDLYVSNNHIIFAGYIDTSINEKIFSSDVTSNTLEIISDEPAYILNSYEGYVYFYKDVGPNESELWRTDGTTTGTELIKTVNGFIERADFPYIQVGGAGNAIWYTDGTSLGTYPLITGANVTIQYQPLSETRTIFLVYRSYGDSPLEIWVSDNTVSGTQLLKSFPLQYDYLGYYSAHISNTVYFQVEDSPPNDDRNLLWQTDGTVSGTKKVNTAFSFTEFRSPFTSGDNVYAVAQISQIFYIIKIQPAGDEQIQIIKTLDDSTNYSDYHFAEMDGNIYFIDKFDGHQVLFRYDGNSVEPISVLNDPDSWFSESYGLEKSIHGFLFFSGYYNKGDVTIFYLDRNMNSLGILFEDDFPQYPSSFIGFDTPLRNKFFYLARSSDSAILYSGEVKQTNLYLPLLIH
jgi:ELWxxDGT repeat protein